MVRGLRSSNLIRGVPGEALDTGLHAAPTAVRRLTLTGAVIGLIGALGLSILRTVNDPIAWELAPGNTVFGLIYMSPYLVAIYASGLLSIAARTPLLLAAATLSFIASFATLSGVSLVLLPATVLLAVARSVRSGPRIAAHGES